jgi:hypothetical protein
VRRQQVVTGGRPVEAVAQAVRDLAGGGVYSVAIGHDDGCPCLHGRPLAECSCEVVRLTRRRVR